MLERKIYNKIFLALNAHIVTPIHKAIDSYREENLDNPIGTTGKGIGPTYVDKFNRIGIRGNDLLDKNNKSKIFDTTDDRINFTFPYHFLNK